MAETPSVRPSWMPQPAMASMASRHAFAIWRLGEIENILYDGDLREWAQSPALRNRRRAGSCRSDALRARMPIVSRLGERGIAPAAGTAP